MIEPSNMTYREYHQAVTDIVKNRFGWPQDRSESFVGDITEMMADGLSAATAAEEVILLGGRE